MRFDGITMQGPLVAKNNATLPISATNGELNYKTGDGLYVYATEWHKIAHYATGILPILNNGTVALTANWAAGAYKISSRQLESTVATGTPGLVIASTDVIPNLNAQMLNSILSDKFVKNNNATDNTITGFDGTKLTFKATASDETNAATVDLVNIKTSANAVKFGINSNGRLKFYNSVNGNSYIEEATGIVSIASSLGITFSASSGGNAKFEDIYIDMANSRIGVNTNAPSFPLDIASNVGTGAGNRYAARFRSLGADDGGLLIDVGDTNADQFALHLKNTGSTILSVKSDGQIGMQTEKYIYCIPNSNLAFGFEDSSTLGMFSGADIGARLTSTSFYIRSAPNVTPIAVDFATHVTSIGGVGMLMDETYIRSKSASTHAMTNEVPANIAGVLQSDTGGGYSLYSYKTATPAQIIKASVSTVNTTKSTAANANVHIVGAKDTGTGGVGALSANANILAIKDNTNTRFIFDAEGDLHADATINANAYDKYDDIALVRALEVHRVPSLNKVYAQWLKYNKQDLQDAKIATFNEDGSVFVNIMAQARLHSGALWQLSERLLASENKVQMLESKLALLGA